MLWDGLEEMIEGGLATAEEMAGDAASFGCKNVLIVLIIQNKTSAG
jgi:hypothetical protein